MMLVFGGTTEGKQVAKHLDLLNIRYFYSTKTKVSFEGNGIPIYGELCRKKIEVLCCEKNIACIINASHPFAEQLHKTIATSQIQVPIIRFERSYSARVAHPLVEYVNSFQEAITLFEKQHFNSLLALSGVQTIEKLSPYWKKHLSHFRILDKDSSRKIAKKASFPAERLLYGYPQDEQEEIILFNRLRPSVIFTKESGINGKLDQKIAAAIAVKIPLVILCKPELSEKYVFINTLETLTRYLNALSLNL